MALDTSSSVPCCRQRDSAVPRCLLLPMSALAATAAMMPREPTLARADTRGSAKDHRALHGGGQKATQRSPRVAAAGAFEATHRIITNLHCAFARLVTVPA